MNLDRFQPPDHEPPIQREPDTEPREDEHYREITRLWRNDLRDQQLKDEQQKKE